MNVLEPDRSLVLLKATGEVPHSGGQRFDRGSWEYRIIRAWIAAGANRDPARPKARAIEIRPAESRLERPGAIGRLTVMARFTDGSEADVTAFADLRVRDTAIADIAGSVAVRGLRSGGTAVVAAYNGLVAAAGVLVATGRTATIPETSGDGLVDREVYSRLLALGITPSGRSGDAEFLRRVTLDVTGALPTPGEVRDFLADQSSDKRAETIDRLLAHPMHAALWAARYLDITGCDVSAMEGPDDLRSRRARLWLDWFRKRFLVNTPYDQIVRGVLCASSRDGDDAGTWVRREVERSIALKAGGDTGYSDRSGLDLFWRRLAGGEFVAVEPLAERVATAFLGVRIECAQCHKHPFDRWTQADYRAFANTVADVQFGLSPEALAATASLLDARRKADPHGALPPIPRVREVYAQAQSPRRLTDPETGRPLAPRALGGPELDDGDAGADIRAQLYAWMVKPDNPYFARSFVNRVWSVYFGAGLVEPVDNFSVTNPPSNARLLDSLADDFIARGYDIRRLERIVLSSEAYQRSSAPLEPNLDDRGSFARSLPRPMIAEVLVDALNSALGVPGDFGSDAPKGARAIEIATNRIASPELARVFRILGRPERTSVCECERPKAPALPQTLFLMTDNGLIARLKSGRVQTLVQSDRCDDQAIEELFLAALSRFPSRDEIRFALDHMRITHDRASALADVLWALINTREFVLNH